MLEKMIDHMFWANSQVLEWIKTERKDAGEHQKLLSHILNVERVWISRANGQGGDRETFKVHPIEVLSAMNEANHKDFQGLIRGETQKLLDYHLFDGTPVKSSFEDMLLHAFSHGFHHAGQMSALASRAGEKFPGVSYLAFSRQR